MLYIFISHYDDCSKNVEKIKETDKKNIKKIYLEDYFAGPFELEEADRVYFLTNTVLALQFIERFGKNNYIINRSYYTRNFNKFETQKLLKDNGLSVPNVLEFEHINKKSFPIMCKSKKHADFVIAVHTLGALNDIFSKYNKNDFYLEQMIDTNEEIKIYFVKDEIYFYDGYKNKKISKEISELCRRISKVLSLEVFSVDVLVNNEKLFVIDVNPAAGLYNSVFARKKLVEWV